MLPECAANVGCRHHQQGTCNVEQYLADAACTVSCSFLFFPAAAICFMNVCFLSALQLWDADITSKALATWSNISQTLLAQ